MPVGLPIVRDLRYALAAHHLAALQVAQIIGNAAGVVAFAQQDFAVGQRYIPFAVFPERLDGKRGAHFFLFIGDAYGRIGKAVERFAFRNFYGKHHERVAVFVPTRHAALFLRQQPRHTAASLHGNDLPVYGFATHRVFIRLGIGRARAVLRLVGVDKVKFVEQPILLLRRHKFRQFVAAILALRTAAVYDVYRIFKVLIPAREQVAVVLHLLRKHGVYLRIDLAQMFFALFEHVSIGKQRIQHGRNRYRNETHAYDHNVFPSSLEHSYTFIHP